MDQGGRCQHDGRPPPVRGAGSAGGAGGYLVNAASAGSLAYAAAAFALVTMTGASRKAGTTFTPLLYDFVSLTGAFLPA